MTHTLIIVFAVLLSPFAFAQQQPDEEYPNRAVRMVVSAPAGGGLDVAARIIADKLRQRFARPFVVENRPGAAGNTGTEVVANAQPDGYTLLAAQPAPLTTNVLLYKKLPFDPTTLEPIAIMTAVPNLLVVRPDFPANSVQEFIAFAKANPGKLNFASQGIGTTPHLTAELFNRAVGTQLVHVPYKGTSQAVNDVVAGHVDLMFLEMQSASQLHKAGRAKVLAITSLQRSPQLPDLPTLVESGVADFRSDTWNALAAPPRTPKAIVAKLNAAVNELLNMPDVRAQFATLSMQPVGGAPADLAELMRSETRRWGEVIRAANLRVE